jgi:cation diffusion facilitator family transporter
MTGHARVAIYSCMLNLCFMGMKYALGDVSGSLALKADAIHSLADVISSLTIFVGILIADRRTKTFPEGLYKVENLVALISSFFIFFAAYEIAMEAWHGEAASRLEHVPIVAAGLLAIIGLAFLFSRYELRVGLEIGSPSLVADAKHVSTDLLSTVVILASVVGAAFGIVLDRYVAVFVALLVARMGLEIFIDAVKVLLDATLDYKTLDSIRMIVESHPDVVEILSIGGRSSGRYKFVEISVCLDIRRLKTAHDLISHLEEEILDRHPSIDKLLVHYEPIRKNITRMATPMDIPADRPADLDSRVSEHFGEATHFALVQRDNRDGTVRLERFLVNPYRELERRKGVKVAEMLRDEEVDEVFTRAELDGKGSGYSLEALGIDAVPTSAITLRQLIEEIGHTPS